MSGGRTLSEAPAASGRAHDLSQLRAGILRRPGLVCAELRTELTAAYDDWLAGSLQAGATGLAVVAVGSYGRREPSPHSDLDLVLLHDGSRTAAEISRLADGIWYPIWDSGTGLDHSVRTPEQALKVAHEDLKALLGLLDVRFVAGDEQLAQRLRGAVLQLWRASAPRRASELREISTARWQRCGEGAYLLEPNLKESRGGLRDAELLVALALAQLVDVPVAVRNAKATLLDVRSELHRIAGRADDVLRLQEHDGVAAALAVTDEAGATDRDEVLRRVNAASRVVAHGLDAAFRRVTAVPVRAPLRQRLFGPSAVVREPLAPDVVSHGGEVVLARDADPRRDPGLILRVARAAAEHRLPVAEFALERLMAETASLPQPWPSDARNDFVALLGAGADAVPVLESLDLAGLLVRLIPEWAAVRSRAQHNPVHRFTVDRHLLETAAQAAARTRDVERPDLLLVGALLHDVGKGYPGDHSIVGADVAGAIARRMGFDERDTSVISALVRHHLLLPDTASRRDPHDPKTIQLVIERVGGSALALDLLHALTVADAVATGPAAWSDWKAGLVSDLAAAVRAVLGGGALPASPPLDAARRALAAAGALAVVVEGREVVVAAPDAVGVLQRTAGVLALHLLDVRSASIATEAGMAVNRFIVEPRFGRVPDAAMLRADLARVLSGELPLDDRLREKQHAYDARPATRPPSVTWFDDEATDATVLEIRTEESVALLSRLTAALERAGLDVRSARVSSLGHSVLGAFYVTDAAGRPVPVTARPGIEAELRTV